MAVIEAVRIEIRPVAYRTAPECRELHIDVEASGMAPIHHREIITVSDFESFFDRLLLRAGDAIKRLIEEESDV